MTSELIWQHLNAPGWEHVRVISDHPGWTVFDSILVREHNGQVLRGGYTLVTDKEWRTLELRLMMESRPGSMEGVHLLTEGDGKWMDANEQPIPELDGCLDVDIQWTPLTHSLPINRLQTSVGDSREVDIVSILLPAMSIHRSTYLYAHVDDARFTVEGKPGPVSVEVDSDGLVNDVDRKFVRTWPRKSTL